MPSSSSGHDGWSLTGGVRPTCRPSCEATWVFVFAPCVDLWSGPPNRRRPPVSWCDDWLPVEHDSTERAYHVAPKGAYHAHAPGWPHPSSIQFCRAPQSSVILIILMNYPELVEVGGLTGAE